MSLQIMDIPCHLLPRRGFNESISPNAHFHFTLTLKKRIRPTGFNRWGGTALLSYEGLIRYYELSLLEVQVTGDGHGHRAADRITSLLNRVTCSQLY